MSIAELEAGLRAMRAPGADRGTFWDEHVPAFRQTVLLAIHDTSNALLSPTISTRWREVLDIQLQGLFRLLELADGHVATCSGAATPSRPN